MSANDWADLEAGEVDYWVAKTPANVSEKLYANQALGGVGQSWHDVTASRDSAVTFTNSTGRPIFLSAIIEATSTNNYQQLPTTLNAVSLSMGIWLHSKGLQPVVQGIQL